MADFDYMGNKIAESAYCITGKTEPGTIAKSVGYISNADSYGSTRCEKAYKVVGDCTGDIVINIKNILSESNTVRVCFFEASGAYVGYTDYSGSRVVFSMMAGAQIFKFTIIHSDSVKRKEYFDIISDMPIVEVGNSNIISTQVGDSLAFNYEVTPDADTTGRLLLPPNYTVDGKKVPLIIFAHGSGCMMSWTSKLGDVIDGSSHISYFPFLQYLANEGYAVFDCFPWTNKETIPENTYSSFNIPMHRQAYLKGVEYVCSRFNVDINNVSVICKSQGGHFGQWAIAQSIFPFKAVCLFAPSTVLGGTLFFNSRCREALTKYVDFAGTTDEIEAFITSGSKYASDETTRALVISFIAKNKDKLLAMTPMTQGITNGNADDIISGVTTPLYSLPQWMIDEGLPEKPAGSQPLFTITENPDYVRHGTVPCKWWSAFDDNQSSGYIHYTCHHWLANGCSETEFRELPIGTGGHHAMDTDANALKSSGTTALGITYTNIPTAYVEAVEFIRSKA